MSSIEHLQSINHHLRHAIEQVSEGILILGTDVDAPTGPKIVFANRAAGVLTGYDPDELKGQPIGLIYDPEHLNDLIARLPRVSETAKTYHMKKNLRRADGENVPIRWTISSVSSGDGVAVNFTITMRQLVDAPVTVSHHEPPAAIAESVSANINQGLEISRVESLALLVGGTAHDFRNALQAIRTKLTLAHLSCPQDNPALQHLVDAEEATKHAHSLAQKILNFTKGKKSKIETVNLTEMLAEVANISTMGTNVRCEIAVAEDLRNLQIETLQMQQVFHNLMINACQAMPEGGVIQVTAQNYDAAQGNPINLKTGPYVRVSVRDRGEGIPEEKVHAIFDPGFTTKEHGTGIGLATCKAIVENHRGAILVASRENIGTEFQVLLPALTTSEISPTKKSNATPAAPATIQRGYGRILVVDDTDSVREAAEQLLAHLGYETVSAANGQQAVQLYRDSALSTKPISAVLLDMTLPGGLSGHEVMTEIRRLDQNARVIATSGYFDDEAAENFETNGWAGVLPKPYAVEDLSQTLALAMKN